MIVVSGTITLDPAKYDQAVEAINTVVSATVQEEGNISYGFFADLNDKGSFRIFEEWEDQAAIDSHMGTPHMATFMGGMGDLGVTGVSLTKYEVSETSKLM